MSRPTVQVWFRCDVCSVQEIHVCELVVVSRDLDRFCFVECDTPDGWTTDRNREPVHTKCKEAKP